MEWPSPQGALTPASRAATTSGNSSAPTPPSLRNMSGHHELAGSGVTRTLMQHPAALPAKQDPAHSIPRQLGYSPGSHLGICNRHMWF